MRMRIAIVGAPEIVAGFALLGAEIAPVHSASEALHELQRLRRAVAKDDVGIERQIFGIIFITEELLAAIPSEEKRKLSSGALPAIIPLPSYQQKTGYGMQRLRHIVEQAIGSNILQ